MTASVANFLCGQFHSFSVRADWFLGTFDFYCRVSILQWKQKQNKVTNIDHKYISNCFVSLKMFPEKLNTWFSCKIERIVYYSGPDRTLSLIIRFILNSKRYILHWLKLSISNTKENISVNFMQQLESSITVKVSGEIPRLYLKKTFIFRNHSQQVFSNNF